jgi:hypothetical protein
MPVKVGPQSSDTNPAKKKQKTQASTPHHRPEGDAGIPDHQDHRENPDIASSPEHTSRDGLVRTTPSENFEKTFAHTKG